MNRGWTAASAFVTPFVSSRTTMRAPFAAKTACEDEAKSVMQMHPGLACPRAA